MGQMLRLLAGLLFVLILATVAMAQGKPTPAWCGGSYSIAEGTNFGACDDNTYPAAPSSQIMFTDDGRVLFQNGELDKDGKAIVVELKMPPTSR